LTTLTIGVELPKDAVADLQYTDWNGEARYTGGNLSCADAVDQTRATIALLRAGAVVADVQVHCSAAGNVWTVVQAVVPEQILIIAGTAAGGAYFHKFGPAIPIVAITAPAQHRRFYGDLSSEHASLWYRQDPGTLERMLLLFKLGSGA